jgi:hypothetical protein
MSSTPDYPATNKRETADTEREVVPTTRARQAVTGHNVRYVLGFGLLGIIVVFAVIWFSYFA